MSFLTAEWRKLAIANYVIDQRVLAPYIPVGTELDLWNGNCYVSLIGFLFKNTRLLGFSIPFHANFEEVNLRFYVRYNDNGIWKRGVVFIKEIVPKFALSVVANTIYNENYEAMPMGHLWTEEEEEREVTYRWRYKGEWQSISLNAHRALSEIIKGSEAEFITEHYWGYTKLRDDKTSEYEVVHPKWEIYPIKRYNIEVDFGIVYGANFAFLNDKTPDSVILAEGSEVKVRSGSQISIKV